MKGNAEVTREDIEAIYPLSAMQQAVLLHSLRLGKSELGFLQNSCILQGDLKVLMFKRAWQQVVDRHPALRTSIYSKDRDRPLQVVRRRVSLPWVEQDWRGLSHGEQQERLESLRQADREQGFDFSKAPLMRLTLVRLSEDAHQLLWSFHHGVMDGWSASVALKEVFAFYAAFCHGQELELARPRPYRDYIAWLQQQDLSEAERFWRQLLKGLEKPTPLPTDRAPAALHDQGKRWDMQQIQLSSTTTATLQALGRQYQVTLNTLVQGAWALILSWHSGEEDVVFGTTVSGRPPAIPGLESVVGLFTNTLPVRVRVSPESSLISWLKALQEQQVEMREYEYAPLVEIQEWSRVPGGVPLFESLLVFENYPVDGSLEQGTGVEIRDFRGAITTSYPLTVVGVPGRELSLQITYDCRRFDAATIRRILRDFQTLLESMTANPDQRLSDIALPTEPERRQLLIPKGTVGHELPAVPDRDRSDLEGRCVGPRTSLEVHIAEVWKDLLGVKSVSVHDNFFDLGGDSLSSMRASARLERTLGVRVNPLDLVFQTLGQFASACETRLQTREQPKRLNSTRRLINVVKRAIFENTNERK